MQPVGTCTLFRHGHVIWRRCSSATVVTDSPLWRRCLSATVVTDSPHKNKQMSVIYESSLVFCSIGVNNSAFITVPTPQQQQQPIRIINQPQQQQQPIILSPAQQPQQQQQPIILKAAPQYQQQQPIRIIAQPQQQQQQQPIILRAAQPQPVRPQPTVMTQFGPVPLLTNIPVIRRVSSHPNLYGHPTPAGTLRRPLVEEIVDDSPIVEFPRHSGSPFDRDDDAYSDIERNMRLNDEIDDIYGSVGQGGYGAPRSRSLYGGSMRSRGTYGRRRSRSASRVGSFRESRAGSRRGSRVFVDDMYERAPGGYTVFEERIPASDFYRY